MKKLNKKLIMTKHTQDIIHQFKIFKSNSDFKIDLLHFIGYEEISKDYEFIVWISIDTNLKNIETFLGCYASIITDTPNKTSFFNGIIEEIECQSLSQNLDGTIKHFLKITIKSALALMKKSHRYAIYQNLSQNEIIRELFNKYALTFKTSSTQNEDQKLEFYNQFNVSDYEFLNQLLSEQGLYFYFNHEFSEHIITLESYQSSNQNKKNGRYTVSYTLSGKDLEFNQIYHFSMQFKNTLISSTATAYNYSNPQSTLKSSYPSTQKSPDFHTYPTNTNTHEKTDQFAKNILLSKETESVNFCFISTIFPLKIANVITISRTQNHPKEQDIFIHKIVHVYSSYKNELPIEMKNALETHGIKNKTEPFINQKISYFNYAVGIPNDKPYLANKVNHVHQNIPPMPARVISYNNQPISIDSIGRIPIQFFWETGMNSSTCWVPLSHSIIGRYWGTMSIPRAGMDVLVNFIHGDINHPIIIGCLSNSENRLSYEQLNQPWSLSYQSNSLTSPQMSHQIAISDQTNNEKIYIKTGKDLECTVNDSLLFNVNQNVNMNIKKGSGNILLLGENASFNIQVGKTNIQILNNQVSVFSQENVLISTKKDLLLSSDQSIQLKASKIEMNSEYLNITSGKLNINSDSISLFASQTIKINAGIKVTLDFPGKTHLFPVK